MAATLPKIENIQLREKTQKSFHFRQNISGNLEIFPKLINIFFITKVTENVSCKQKIFIITKNIACLTKACCCYLVVRYVEQVWDGVGGGQGLGVAVVLAGARVVEHASLALYLYTLS